MSKILPNQFSAGAYCRLDSSDNKDKLLGASVIAHVDKYGVKKILNLPLGVKFPGGTNKEEYWDVKDGEKVKIVVYRDQSAAQTFIDECKEELQCKPIGFILCHKYSVSPKDNSETVHFKYFYVVHELSEPRLFDYKREFEDGDDTVFIKYWTISDFLSSVINSHLEAFVKIFLELCKEKDFRDRNIEIFNNKRFITGFLSLAKNDEKFRQDNQEMFDRFSKMKFK